MGADLYLIQKNKKADYRNNSKENYYRDSYNDWNLLWKFGLDYWVWFKKLLNKDGILTPQKAQEVLDTLFAKEDIFNKNIESLPKDDQTYFEAKYVELRTFLSKAVSSDGVDCSI